MDNKLELPEAFDFEDLGLVREPNSEIHIVNFALLEDVVEFNGIHIRSFRDRPYYTFLAVWALRDCYRSHLDQGGKPNKIMEELNTNAQQGG